MRTGRVFLGLGSSLGDRHRHIEGAIRRLAELPRFMLLRTASIYETRAVGDDGPPFINTAVCGWWDGEPQDLLAACQKIENAHGRTRPYTDAPRTLDIDVLYWEDRAYESTTLEIPHPRLTARAFALVPLLELAPDLCDPRTGRPLASHLTAELLEQGICEVCREAARG